MISPSIGSVCIVGLGLIGGSLAMALKKSGNVERVLGVDIDHATITDAEETGAVDKGTDDLAEGVRDADCVIIATPVRRVVSVFEACVEHVKPDSVISDVASTKSYIAEAVLASGKAGRPGRPAFVGGHPMAGSEKSGIRAADPYLFENALYVLTPLVPVGDGDGSFDLEEGETAKQQETALSMMRTIVTSVGAEPVIMSPVEHDAAVAAVSHLPHAVAVCLVNFLGNRAKSTPAALALAAGGFRDTTRIASGDSGIWSDIFGSNRNQVLRAIEEFQAVLDSFKSLLLSGDEAALKLHLDAARELRSQIPAHTKGMISPVYELVVQVVDRPGSISEVATTLASNGINIKDIEILRIREGEGGTLKIGVETPESLDAALVVLRSSGFEARKR